MRTMLQPRSMAAAQRYCTSKSGMRCKITPARPRMACVRGRRVDVRAENEQFGLAPAKPKTPYGEMLQYYLKMQPQLFQSAVEQQLQRLKEEKEAKEAADQLQKSQEEESDAEAAPPQRSSSELVLRQRMEEVRALEVQATLEDLMYVSILEKFVVLGVEMLPRMDGFVEPGPANLLAMTEGLHSREALELIKEHLLGIMGPTADSRFSTQLLKMSKFQMAQVYAASVMFGYFLRRVDRRFQLEKSLGSLSTPEGRDDAVARLEALFAASEDMDGTEDPDRPAPTTSSSSSSGSSASRGGGSRDAEEGPVVDVGAAADDLPEDDRVSSSSGASSSSQSATTGFWDGRGAGAASSSGRKRSALREYVESFDQATMVETARIVSLEGAALVERQTHALFGDLRLLTLQMQRALGDNITSADQLYARMEEVVQGNKVDTVTMTVATQKRCVLEAVAFGTFLRDVESHVSTEYGLLTPKAPPQLPPGMDASPF